MNTSRLRPLRPLLVLALLAGCAAVEADRSAPAGTADVDELIARDDAERGERYAFVWLLAGEGAAELAPDELEKATAGHFENMAQLSEDGLLLLAGPLAEPRWRSEQRGIFVLDVATAERGRELAASDPAVQAGVFRTSVTTLRSRAPFRELLEVMRDEQAQAKAAEAELSMRGYVLVGSRHGEEAERALAPLVEEGSVLFQGRFGGDDTGASLFALDATDVEQAREMVAFASGGIDFAFEWSYSPWYGPQVVERLPELAAKP